MAADILIFTHGFPFLEIRASTESIVRLAGEDQGTCRTFATLTMQALHHPTQLGQQLRGEGIPRRRPIQREHRDATRVRCRYTGDLDGRCQGAVGAHTGLLQPYAMSSGGLHNTKKHDSDVESSPGR